MHLMLDTFPLPYWFIPLHCFIIFRFREYLTKFQIFCLLLWTLLSIITFYINIFPIFLLYYILFYGGFISRCCRAKSIPFFYKTCANIGLWTIALILVLWCTPILLLWQNSLYFQGIDLLEIYKRPTLRNTKFLSFLDDSGIKCYCVDVFNIWDLPEYSNCRYSFKSPQFVRSRKLSLEFQGLTTHGIQLKLNENLLKGKYKICKVSSCNSFSTMGNPLYGLHYCKYHYIRWNLLD